MKTTKTEIIKALLDDPKVDSVWVDHDLYGISASDSFDDVEEFNLMGNMPDSRIQSFEPIYCAKTTKEIGA